jgi:hypothetical protein
MRVADLPSYAQAELGRAFDEQTLSAARIFAGVPLTSLRSKIGWINRLTELFGGTRPTAQTFESNIYIESFEPGLFSDRVRLAHELVHVHQYLLLGYEGFKEAYKDAVIGGYSYRQIPLERQAYEFTTGWPSVGRLGDALPEGIRQKAGRFGLPVAASTTIGNATLYFGGIAYKFADHEWRDTEITDAWASIDTVGSAPWTGSKDNYLVQFGGCFGGGNGYGRTIVLVHCSGGTTRQLTEVDDRDIGVSEVPSDFHVYMGSGEGIVSLRNRALTTVSSMWVEGDPHCCPTYELTRTWSFSGGRFHVVRGVLTRKEY